MLYNSDINASLFLSLFYPQVEVSPSYTEIFYSFCYTMIQQLELQDSNPRLKSGALHLMRHIRYTLLYTVENRNAYAQLYQSSTVV